MKSNENKKKKTADDELIFEENVAPGKKGAKTQVTAPATHNYNPPVIDTDDMPHTDDHSPGSIVSKASGHHPSGKGNAEPGDEEYSGADYTKSNSDKKSA